MDAIVQHAIGELAASAAPLVAITVPAPVVPIDTAACAALGEPVLRWDSPVPESGGRAFSFVGFGESARVEGNGEARFEEIRRGADELFARLAERRHPEAAFAPPPRLFGGLAFRAEPMRAAPWSAFRDASFALPRWLYGTDGERAFLRSVTPRAEIVGAQTIEGALAALAAGGDRAPHAEATEALLERTSPEVWGAMIDDALARIRAGEMTKVVPMALCKVVARAALDPAAVLARLGALYPECVRFAFQRGDAVFLGASPERLVQKSGLAVEADALAGSAPRRPEADARAASALLESDKDRREHRVVVDAIESALSPLARELRVPSVPVVRTLRNVHHLWTPITATLARPLHVLDLVRTLHPTPAVCGTPREAAIRWIAAHEPAPRGWYAGAVGWFDAAGDGAFSVAIRSGVLSRREAWLYAGAGIVEGSDAALEYAETRTKQAPMLAALGLLP
ncbi:Isochorismate synthase [Minicystis rosea]|nr:Isochorismate synthase [Minicystis rosea]